MPLKDFTNSVLEECEDDLTRLENICIDEIVHYPSVLGCYKKDEKYVIYYTSEYGHMEEKIYDDPIRFMNSLIMNSSINTKFP